MTDIWVCSQCSSINRQRNERCYKCGARQAEAATGDLADTRVERAILTRAVTPYRGSLLRGIVAAAFIVAVAVLGVVVLNESLDAVRWLRDEVPVILQTGVIDEDELARQSAGALIPSALYTICAIGGLLFFAAWLSRVVANIPALGGGTPKATPARAFIYPLIPVWNLFKVPPMIQEALYKLDPKAGGFFMILLAWVGLVGSWIVSFVVGWWYDLRLISIADNAESMSEAIEGIQSAIDLYVIVEIVTTLMVSAGALVLVLVMFRIERRERARNREVIAAFRAGTTNIGPSGSPVPEPVREAPVAAPAPVVAAAPVAAASPVAGAVVAPQAAPVVDPMPPAVGTAVSATALGASPFGSGPRLSVVVVGDAITASVDGSAPEPTTLDELREAASTLAQAGGTASVERTGAADAGDLAGQIVAIFRGAGIPTAGG